MSVPSTGRVYGDAEKTPVPFPHYRCKATAADLRDNGMRLTHFCKVTVDHDGLHRCICGKAWEPVSAVAS